MARNEDRKAELIAQLALARAQLDRSGEEFRTSLDVAARLKQSVRRHVFVWMGSAALIGLLLAKLRSRTRRVSVDADGHPAKFSAASPTGFLAVVSKVALDLARPILLKAARDRLQPIIEEWLRRRSER
jgi:hypothetical protein